MRHHRAHRRGRREDVGDLVAREEVELLLGVEAALALQHDLRRAVAPRARAAVRCRPPTPTRPCRGSARRRGRRGSRRTPRGRGCSDGRARCPWPGRSCRTCSTAAPGRPRRCRRSRTRSRRRRAAPVDRQHLAAPVVEARAVGLVGDQHARVGVVEAVADAVVAVEHRHRQQDRPRSSRCRRRSPPSRASAAARPRRARPARRRARAARWPPGWRGPAARPSSARGASPSKSLPDHRRLVARVLVAHVRARC